jgi:hypothetical protein
LFVWRVWVSVSEKSLATILDLWNTEIRADQAPMFAWLWNDIQGYPRTFGLKANLHLRNNGQCPFIGLEPTDHPLAREQREGITLIMVTKLSALTLMDCFG